MLKKAVSIILLVMYLHGISGYTMSFHTCLVTGFENVYTGYGLEDPCGEDDKDCSETSTHFETADCCDLEQTVVSVDNEGDLANLKLLVSATPIIYTLFSSYFNADKSQQHSFYHSDYFVKPPKLCDICIFRI